MIDSLFLYWFGILSSFIWNYPDLQLSDTSKCHKNIKIWESKIYGVPKRRRFSAIRDFPSGCGPQAANVNKHECTEDTASPKVKFSLNEKGVSIEDSSPSENMQVKGQKQVNQNISVYFRVRERVLCKQERGNYSIITKS